MILKRHAHVVETMAEGLIELRENDGVDIASERGIFYCLKLFQINSTFQESNTSWTASTSTASRFACCKINIWYLETHICILFFKLQVVFGNVLPESPRHVGCIDPACDVEAVVQDAFENARYFSFFKNIQKIIFFKHFLFLDFSAIGTI